MAMKNRNRERCIHTSAHRDTQSWDVHTVCRAGMQTHKAPGPGVLTSNTLSADQHKNSVLGDSCTHSNHLLQQSARGKHRGEDGAARTWALNLSQRWPNEHTPSPADTCMQYLCPRQPTQESVKRLYCSFICQFDRIAEEKPMFNIKEVEQFYQPHGNFYKLPSPVTLAHPDMLCQVFSVENHTHSSS